MEGMFSHEGEKLLPLRAIAEYATYKFIKFEKTLSQIKEEVPHLLSSIAPLSSLFDSTQQLKQEKADRQDNLLIAEL